MNFLSLVKTSLQQSSKHYFINLVLFVMIIGDLLQSRPCLFQLPIIFYLFLKFLQECIIQVEATFLLRISMWNVNEDFNCLKHKLLQDTNLERGLHKLYVIQNCRFTFCMHSKASISIPQSY